MDSLNVSAKNEVILLRRRLVHYEWVEIIASGYSMYPFIHPGDICRFMPAELARLQIGDVILFDSGAGCLIGHRLLRIESQNGHTYLTCKGDTNLFPDARVEWPKALAVLAEIKRAKRRILTDGKLMRFWGKLVIRTPFYSRCIRFYLNFRLRRKSA